MRVKHLAVVAAGVLFVGGAAVAEEATEQSFEPYVGEVTVQTLNVRSGPSTNYYVVTRIPAGARVKVVGEVSDWLEIAPPEGCYSLIAAKYVDVGDGVSGVVNANNIRVRAGSDRPDYKPYAVQAKLRRGALVRIIGPARERLDDLPDEPLLRIEPPTGVALYVSGEFIHRVTGELLNTETPYAAARPKDTRAAPVRLDTETAAADSLDEPPGFESTLPGVGSPPPASTVVGAEGESEEPTSEVAAVPATEYRRQLEAVEITLKEEMAKPLMRRDFSDLLPTYSELADQEVDTYTQAYAGVRVRQIEAASEVIAGMREVRRLHDDIRSVRKAARAERANLRPIPVKIGGGFDIEGELRPSALYDSPVGPQRYRLIDPSAEWPRTLAYVEIPPHSDIDAASFLGRRVGVRAHERVLQTGDVNPISIYIASELVVLDRPADTPELPVSIEETVTTSKP